jgi:hypothetical protein
MKSFLDTLFGLDEEHSIWIENEELGTEKLIQHRKKRYRVKIPENIQKKVILRLKGIGKKRGHKTGDLYLHVWLNRGEDIWTNLWLSETSARNGESQRLRLTDRNIRVKIPRGSSHGQVIRLKGLGREPNPRSKVPPTERKPGNLMIRLCIYPDTVSPKYGSFGTLTTDDMFLEGWVFLKFDQIIQKIGKAEFPSAPIKADLVAENFNLHGWRGVFQILLDYLKLTDMAIEIKKSSTLSAPGMCEKTLITQDNHTSRKYSITIHQQFLDHPFSIAAILAHELCHVVYCEKIQSPADSSAYNFQNKKASLEEERTVDLLVFMYQLGEFQLRVARDKRLTIGYFNQTIFDRIQVIVSKKMASADL